VAVVTNVEGPNDKGTFKAHFDDGGSITFGRVSEPPVWKNNPKQREYWANNYWWVALEGNPHTSYIVDKSPLNGTSLNLVEIRHGNSKDASIWGAIAIAVLGEADFDR